MLCSPGYSSKIAVYKHTNFIILKIYYLNIRTNRHLRKMIQKSNLTNVEDSKVWYRHIAYALDAFICLTRSQGWVHF